MSIQDEGAGEGMASFKLDSELEDFRLKARVFAEEHFSVKAAHWDEAEEYPAEDRSPRRVDSWESVTG